MTASESQKFRKKAKEYAVKHFGLKDDTSAGKYFESMMSGFMMAYVEKYNESMDEDEIPITIKYDKAEDFINGTDLKITDKSRTMLFDMEILKIDPTANLMSKKEMPILAKPNSSLNMELKGTDFEIRYGIRIGNQDHAFREPVIVMGLYPKRGYEKEKITKAQAEDAVQALWGSDHPERYIGTLVDNAAQLRNIVNDLNEGIENNGTAELMINERYIEHESRRQSVSGTNRRCGSFITRNGKLVLDETTKEPKWHRTSELWMTSSAHNVIVMAKEIAVQSAAGPETMEVLDRLTAERTRGDVDPPMMQISEQIVRYFEEKDERRKAEFDFTKSVYSIEEDGGFAL